VIGGIGDKARRLDPSTEKLRRSAELQLCAKNLPLFARNWSSALPPKKLRISCCANGKQSYGTNRLKTQLDVEVKSRESSGKS